MDTLTIAASTVLLGAVILAAGWVASRLWRAGMRERQPLLMYQVLERAGVSLDRCMEEGALVQMAAGARRCLLCRDRETCVAWLDGDSSALLEAFCPNADLIRRLGMQEVRRRATAGLPQTS